MLWLIIWYQCTLLTGCKGTKLWMLFFKLQYVYSAYEPKWNEKSLSSTYFGLTVHIKMHIFGGKDPLWCHLRGYMGKLGDLEYKGIILETIFPLEDKQTTKRTGMSQWGLSGCPPTVKKKKKKDLSKHRMLCSGPGPWASRKLGSSSSLARWLKRKLALLCSLMIRLTPLLLDMVCVNRLNRCPLGDKARLSPSRPQEVIGQMCES